MLLDNNNNSLTATIMASSLHARYIDQAYELGAFMSLSTRVFIFFAALMMIMLGSQWFVMRTVTNDVSSELGKVAFSVARDTASFFILGDNTWYGNTVHSQRTEARTQIESSVKTQSGSFTIIRQPPPTVEIRIDNQRTDNIIQLISSNQVVDIPLPRDELLQAVESMQSRLIVSSLFILGVGLLLAAMLARRLVKPVTDLSEAASNLAQGQLGVQISPSGSSVVREIQTSIDTFNAMSTQLAAMQKENRELQANAHYKELGYISSGLAHSIRNPLNTLGLTIEQIIDYESDSEQRSNLVKSAYRQIHRIDNWVKTFMTFALGADAQTEQVSLRSVLANIKAEASQLKPLVRVELDMQDDILITGIEAELHAMFHSLVINAVDASPDNETVSLTIHSDNGHCCCLIQDNGPGIPEKIQENLFQPQKTTKSKGSGMGLFMAQKLAENRYQGNIRLVSSDNTGTQIEIQLDKARKV
jgi:signal transduction histidine kinase